jgi:hypothetical protein
MFTTKKCALRRNGHLPGGLQVRDAIRLGIVFIAVFAACSLPVVAHGDAATAQIEAGHLRIEFDRRLHSRVIARFDKTETALGPLTASETLTTAGKVWTDFPLTSQKQERVKDAFGGGRG